jgi:small multidrug resistance family-3 protein
LGGSAWRLAPGALALALFAWLLTLHPPVGAGRIHAAYGGVYVAASLLWLWLVEGARPDRWDVLGSALCIAGTAVILIYSHHPGVPYRELLVVPEKSEPPGVRSALDCASPL